MFIFYHFTFLGKIMSGFTRRFKLPQTIFSSLLLNFWPLLMIFQSGACKMSNHRRGAHRLFPQFTVPPPLPKHMPIGTYILTYWTDKPKMGFFVISGFKLFIYFGICIFFYSCLEGFYMLGFKPVFLKLVKFRPSPSVNQIKVSNLFRRLLFMILVGYTVYQLSLVFDTLNSSSMQSDELF